MSEEKTTLARPLVASDAIVDKDSYAADWRRWKSMIASKALPKHVTTPEMAITIAAIGEQFGWPALRSLRSIYIVEGRPEMSAESMMALVREKCPEAIIQPLIMSAKEVSIAVTRPPAPEPCVVKVSIDQFRHLASKANWKNYPESMLWARCVSRVARRIFPDVIAGAYTIGELSESDGGITVSQRRGPEVAAVAALDAFAAPAEAEESHVEPIEVDWGDAREAQEEE